VAGRLEQLSDGAELDELARIHDPQLVGGFGDDAEVMADEQDRGVHLLDELLHEGQDLRLDRHVERARRLVRDEELGLFRERHRDHHPLAHPARQLVGIEVEDRLRVVDPDEPEVLENLVPQPLPPPPAPDRPRGRPAGNDRPQERLARLGRGALGVVERRGGAVVDDEIALVPDPADVDRFRHLVVDAERGVERVERLLEDHVDSGAPDRRHLPEGDLYEVDPSEDDAALPDRRRRLWQQTRDRLRERALPAARLADDPYHVALGHLERHPGDGPEAASSDDVVDGEVLDLDDRLRHGDALTPPPRSG